MTIQSLSYKDLPYGLRRGIRPQAEAPSLGDSDQPEEASKDTENKASTSTEEED